MDSKSEPTKGMIRQFTVLTTSTEHDSQTISTIKYNFWEFFFFKFSNLGFSTSNKSETMCKTFTYDKIAAKKKKERKILLLARIPFFWTR